MSVFKKGLVLVVLFSLPLGAFAEGDKPYSAVEQSEQAKAVKEGRALNPYDRPAEKSKAWLNRARKRIQSKTPKSPAPIKRRNSR